MKLLIDGRSLQQRPITGVQRYARNAISWLRRLGVELDVWESCLPGRVLPQLSRQFLLPRKAAGYDVLFCPANLGPANLSRKTGLVVTLHSMAVLAQPEFYESRFATWYRWALPWAIDRADRIVTVSQAQKLEILRFFPETADRMDVIAHGLDERFLRPSRPAGPASLPYILFVGGDSLGKGLCTLLQAFSQIHRQVPHQLVIAGGHSGILKADSSLGKLLSGFSRERYSFRTVDDEESMAQLYAGASVLVVPSLYESFCLPALEAMGCGCPVIASDLPAIRETTGDAALLIDPGNAEALAASIRCVLEDPREALRLVQAGTHRAAEFTWQRCAEQTLSVLEKARKA